MVVNIKEKEMLEKKSPKEISKKFIEHDKKDLALSLAKVQRKCIDKNIPVVITIDGWESSGKGYVINELVKELDTKHYRVSVFERDIIDDDYEYLRNLWRNIPPYGNFRILYRSIYTSLFNELKASDKKLEDRISSIRATEKLLTDDKGIVLKYFLDIDEKTLKNNVEDLKDDKTRNFFVTKDDNNQVKNYKEHRDQMDKVLELTDFDFAKWEVVPSLDRREAAKYILGHAIETIESKLVEIEERLKEESSYKFKRDDVVESIKNLDLSKKVDKEEYDIEIEELQDKARDLAYKLYSAEVPTVVVFEGIDAAGKGGSIARLLRKIDPRIYSVNPTSAPSDLEKKHHYLWRFYNNLPKKGNIAVFDRSWYGRVLVERVEGFANDFEWSRSYDEINNMERDLVDKGVLLLKYHLVISKDEQEQRFKDREVEKPFKITDEDWRNREKWDKYIDAMDDMIKYTSTEYAPWKVISSQDKRYARLEVLKDFIKAAEGILG